MAVAMAMANSKCAKQTVQEYFEDLERIKQSETVPITSIDNVFFTLLTYITIATS
jgi:hypothetical protein